MNILPKMEYSDVIHHSSAFFELSLNIIPKIEDSDVIHHSSVFFKLSLNVLPKMEYGDVIYHQRHFEGAGGTGYACCHSLICR